MFYDGGVCVSGEGVDLWTNSHNCWLSDVGEVSG